MMQQNNPFDAFDQPVRPGRVVLPGAPADPSKEPLTAAQLVIEQARANQASAQQKADTRIKNAQADKIERDNGDTAASDAAARMGPSSQLTGDAYLRAFVPPSQWQLVKAMARGDAGARQGINKTTLPLFQHAMNYDHTRSMANFPARVAMTTDLASHAPGSMGTYLSALGAVAAHSKLEENAIGGLDNPSGVWGRFGGSSLNYKLHNEGAATGSAFDTANQTFADEKVKAILAGNAGAVPDRAAALKEVAPDMAKDAQFASLRTTARQIYDKYQEQELRYSRVMGGQSIPMPMRQEDAAQLLHLMRLGNDGKEGPMPAGITPAFLSFAAGVTPTVGGNGPGSGGMGPMGGNPSSPTGSLATGDTKSARDPARETAISNMFRDMVASGKVDPQAISAANVKMGGMPISPDDVTKMTALVKGGFNGNLIDTSVATPTTPWNRFAASPVGTGIYAGLDAAMGGTTDEMANLVGGGDLSDLNARKQAAFAANPKSTLLGQTMGTIGGMAAFGSAGRALGLGADLIPQLAGDVAFSAGSGAGQDNDNRIGGALAGGVGGLGGNLLGQGMSRVIGAAARTAPGLALTNRLGMFAGRSPITPVPSLSPAETATLAAVNRAGPDAVTNSLTEAQNLNLPMSLADTNPNLRELAGAAVRRSPTASSFAEDNLIPRSRGQYERLAGAVDQHLGPTANIPQISADLTQQAKTAAGPLYDKAYAAPGASSVDLSDLAQRPSMQAGLSRAYGIAKEEGRDPTSLGFDLDGQGNVTLNRVPSFQTMDYVKRGIDDTLEPYRNPMTNKLALNESTRAINATKNDFLGRVDAVNPDYAAARAAFAGPSQAKDALGAGYDAFTANPNQLGVDVAGASPDRLAQMQVGYRGGLMDAAERLRYNSNPFDGTLGTPAAAQRLGTLYPDTPGVADLLRTRDLEGGMQQTTNAILGNSRTARNQIADQSFMPSPLVDGAMHAGAAMITHGASLPATASRFAGSGLSDAFKFGIGNRAIAKADDIAPMLMTPDPSAGLATVGDLLSRDGSYNAFVKATQPKLGMFGTAFGGQAVTAPLNYWQ